MNRMDVWCTRRPNGALAYPRTVRAHIVAIMMERPDFLTDEELKNLPRYDELREAHISAR